MILHKKKYKKIYKLENIQRATIVKRPSAYCKTPYVADIITEDEKKTMGHTQRWVVVVYVIKMRCTNHAIKKSTGVCNFH